MKKYKNVPASERISFYYNYAGKKIDEDVEHVTARNVADELGLNASSSITKDFFELLQKPGRKNYGYNTVFLYNEFGKILKLDTPRKVYIVGKNYPFFDMETLQKRNFIFSGISSEFNSNEIIEKEIDILILTKKVSLKKLKELEGRISGIINISGEIYKNISIPIYNFDIVEIVLDMWSSLVEDGMIIDN